MAFVIIAFYFLFLGWQKKGRLNLNWKRNHWEEIQSINRNVAPRKYKRDGCVIWTPWEVKYYAASQADISIILTLVTNLNHT